MKIKTSILLLILVFSISVFAQSENETAFERRANDAVKMINEPKDFENVFSKSFLSQVPSDQIKEISTQLVTDYGKALKVQKIDKKDDYNGTISILFEKNIIVNLGLSIEQTGTNLIRSLLINSVEQVANSLQSIVDALKKLPGKTSLSVAKLNDKDFQTLATHNADTPFAVGSTFKLYVLSELVRQISEGKRNWSDIVELKHFSLPSGQMQDWEKGSPVTLHTLSSMMISLSDNTATDQLLRTLGRENIENILKTAGNSNPDLSKPFLTTAEMFMLKGLAKQEYAKKYVATDIDGKRKILANEIAKSNPKDIPIEGFLAKPTYISEIEWFASANDLVRLMNWLRMNTEKAPTNRALGVMAINKALSEKVANNWKYVGYKGGSETGVISMTYLLQSKKGEWFVVTSSWNNENEAVKQDSFILLIQTAVKILQEQIK